MELNIEWKKEEQDCKKGIGSLINQNVLVNDYGKIFLGVFGNFRFL